MSLISIKSCEFSQGAFLGPEPSLQMSETLRVLRSLRSGELGLVSQVAAIEERFDGVTDILHIGMGGSCLGPQMLYDTFKDRLPRRCDCHFLSTFHDAKLGQLMDSLNPSTTLVILVSKSGTTVEMLYHWQALSAWFQGSGLDPQEHVLGVTSQPEKLVSAGVHPSCIARIPDAVGGRFSVWTAVSLSIVLCYGLSFYESFLEGGAEVDASVEDEESSSMPWHLASQSAFFMRECGYQTQAIIPYAQELSGLVGYLQQLHMESLGKSVTTSGEPIAELTCPIIWGGIGTDVQHSFFQLIMQGQHHVPIDFVMPLEPAQSTNELYDQLMAQSSVLSEGYKASAIQRDEPGVSEDLIPHKMIHGEQPHNIIALEGLTPRSIGALLAVYEYKVLYMAQLFQINPFDQWGVERAKMLCRSQADPQVQELKL